MSAVFTVLAVAAAVAFIFVHEKGMEPLKLPYKTAASISFTLLGAVCLVQTGVSIYGILVLAALMLGCIGDIFLQIPKGGDGCFIAGLIAFLLGHLVYIAAFAVKTGLLWIQPVAAVVLFAAVMVLLRLLRADFGAQKALVYAYAAVIAVMMGCALTVGPMASIAAALFVVSDLVLALIRFAGKTRKGMTLINLVTYYTAQIMLALSVAMI